MRSLYRDLRAYLGARLRLSKSHKNTEISAQLLERSQSLYVARFRVMANAARSGDLILGMRVLLWDREFRSTAARSRQEDHAARGKLSSIIVARSPARSWLGIKAVCSWRLRQGEFKISKLVELMYWGVYWGGRQRGKERRSLLRAYECNCWIVAFGQNGKICEAVN